MLILTSQVPMHIQWLWLLLCDRPNYHCHTLTYQLVRMAGPKAWSPSLGFSCSTNIGDFIWAEYMPTSTGSDNYVGIIEIYTAMRSYL